MAENELPGPVLGVAWDGTGFGPDGTVWGGEFLRVGPGAAVRVATFRSFALPGGDRAIREPRRSAVGVLHELLGDELWARTDLPPLLAMSRMELAVVRRMLERQLNAPRTSSVGRLFDAIASLLGLRQRAAFEGQAAVLVELAAAEAAAGTYPFEFGERDGSPVAPDAVSVLVIDWRPFIAGVMNDLSSGTPIPTVACRVHRALADVVVHVARREAVPAVALSGGCFQNRLLTRLAVEALHEAGFRAYWHQRVPPNDGGISLGQVAALALGVATGPAN
jgi:hydrogenase maturation protein HypF